MILWPHVCQYLIDNLPGLPGWSVVQVSDGPTVGADDPDNYCTVGHVTDDNGGSFTQEHLDDFLYTEVGTVRGTLTCQAGDDSPRVTRDRGAGLIDAFDSFLRADQSLGGLLTAGTALFHADAAQTIVNQRGTAFEVIWTVAYSGATTFPG